jgi:hypothetical protein
MFFEWGNRLLLVQSFPHQFFLLREYLVWFFMEQIIFEIAIVQVPKVFHKTKLKSS